MTASSAVTSPETPPVLHLLSHLHSKKSSAPFTSNPDPDKLKQALQVGGQIDLDVKSGAGTFKTAQKIELSLSPLRPSGLRSISSQLIAGRCPYLNHSGAKPKPLFLQLSMGDKSKQLYREANILYWAIVLLDLAFSQVNQCIDVMKEPPPFDIPCLHFIEASFMFAYTLDHADDCQGAGGHQPGTVRSTFLAKEIICSNFFKYIHNSSASPHQLADLHANNIAHFLSFT
ncbi:hypothetical protein JVT61DRAFT_9936 [Boletus reticuloceps]|uniref:Uncharacterized protein n=1 Tax=Boletus reticuloceps TaxID=495285 RepID=A0A8I2YFV0_9AGAM|nr:hypothetical protein JVT61DRAFT_9936 [Boletus reticuloceps]